MSRWLQSRISCQTCAYAHGTAEKRLCVLQRKRRRGAEPKAEKRVKVESKADSDAESDGYGEGGLSWEAVLASVQVTF